MQHLRVTGRKTLERRLRLTAKLRRLRELSHVEQTTISGVLAYWLQSESALCRVPTGAPTVPANPRSQLWS